MSGDYGGRAQPPAEVLRASLESLIAESQALRADVHGAEQARRRANKINLGVLAFVALFVVMLVAIVWQNNQVVNQVRKTNNTLVDCTTPGGVCHEQGQQRTGAAITALTRISIYVSQCGRLYPGESGPEFDVKIEKCVAERLSRAQTQTVPSPSAGPSGAPR